MELTTADVHPVTLRETSGLGVELYFPAARNPKAIASSALFFSLWTVIFAVLLKLNVPIIFPIMWGLFDAITFTMVLSFLFYSIRVQAGPEGVTILHRLLVPTSTRTLGVDEILEIKPGIKMRAGQKHYYCLKISTRDGRTYSAGDGIQDKRRAEWLAAKLSHALGLAGERFPGADAGGYSSLLSVCG